MSVDQSGWHKDMDTTEHVRTYNGFIKGAVILILAVVALLLGMLFFLV